MFTSPDVPGCVIVHVFHVIDGGYLGPSINGLTAIEVPFYAPSVKQSKFKSADGRPIQTLLYLPSNATEKQRRTLQGAILENDLMLGMEGYAVREAPVLFKATTGRASGVHRAGMPGFSIKIPGVLDLETKALAGANGKPVMADNLGLSEGSHWTIGQSIANVYQSPDEKAWKWSMPGGNGSWTHFSWAWYDRP